MANPKRHPNPVGDWADALATELCGPVIPQHAESLDDIRARIELRGQSLTDRGITLRMRKISGGFNSAIGRKPGDKKARLYIWPK